VEQQHSTKSVLSPISWFWLAGLVLFAGPRLYSSDWDLQCLVQLKVKTRSRRFGLHTFVLLAFIMAHSVDKRLWPLQSSHCCSGGLSLGVWPPRLLIYFSSSGICNLVLIRAESRALTDSSSGYLFSASGGLSNRVFILALVTLLDVSYWVY